MRRLRFQPFGFLGATLELLIGTYVIVGVLTDDNDYSPVFVSIVVFLGATLVVVGLVSIAVGVRRRYGA